MTKPTQDKETLREAVARALCELRIRTIRRHDTPPDELEAMLPAAVNYVWREHLPQADAAIATMFERLRDLVPAIYEGPDQFLRKADVLAAFQQENSDG